MSIYSSLAEKLQYISPDFYKKRFFKKLINLTRENVLTRNIEPEMFWIKEYLKPDSVFFDIGANVGAYIFVLEHYLKNENIIGFEPNKQLYNRLKRVFPDINFFPIALSDNNETADFKIPKVNGKTLSSRGTLVTDLLEKGENDSVIEKVEVQKLDDWKELKNIKKIDFIKIDVEGNEMKTLYGAQNTIKKHKPTLMVEIEQRHHFEPVWKLVSEIENWGFGAYYFDRYFFEIKELSEDIMTSQNNGDVKNKKDYINNIIFIAKT